MSTFKTSTTANPVARLFRFFIRVQLIAVMLISATSYAQDEPPAAYEINHDYNGFTQVIYNSDLETLAGRVKDSISLETVNGTPLTFDIIGHHYYTLRNYGTNKAYFDEIFETAHESDCGDRDAYLLIAKNQPDTRFEYRIRLVLPTEGSYAELTAIQRLAVEAEVLKAIEDSAAGNEGSSLRNADNEQAGLERLLTLVGQIQREELDLDNPWSQAGFEAVPVNPDEIISRDLGSSPDDGVVGKVEYRDFAGIEIVDGTTSDLYRNDLIRGTTASNDSVFAFQDYLYIITDDLNSASEVTEAADAFEQSDRKLVLWFHHGISSTGSDTMYIKSKDNYTFPEVEVLVNYYFDRAMKIWSGEEVSQGVGQPSARETPEDSAGKSLDICNDSCELDWQWGKKCLIPRAQADCYQELGQSLGMESLEFRLGIGFVIGLLDGLIGTVELVAQAADSWWGSIEKWFSRKVTYLGSLVDHYKKISHSFHY